MGEDPFDVLGLDATFLIDEAELQRAWLRRSAQLHPDRAADPAGASVEIARLNDAKRRLSDPELRARALLARLSGQATEEDRSLPDGFLQEIMEIRQSMEKAREEGDRETLENWSVWAESQRLAHMERIGALFAEYATQEDQATHVEIRRELNAWRYIERMLEQMHPAN